MKRVYYSRVGVYNAVFSGKLRKAPSKSLSTKNPLTNESEKFCAVTVTVAGSNIQVYKNGAVVIPGVDSPEHLNDACTGLLKVLEEHK